MAGEQNIRNLEPSALWNHFADLNSIPRASKKEAGAVAFVKKFGASLGLETVEDRGGNVIIRKPASPGMEARPVVILQGHLDMVHQKNAGTDFNFDTDGIRSVVDGDWVRAEGTTLGADNGIGVAAIMAILESKDLVHPPLEALFTVDEETGMSGALNLEAGLLQGKIMLNLDSEEEDELTIGCAGGLDSFSEASYATMPSPVQSRAFEIVVKGLKGGHSGIDIHLGRANANKVLTRLLYDGLVEYGMHLARFSGGNLRNAIPREAAAMVVVPNAMEAVWRSHLDGLIQSIVEEYAWIEPDMKVEVLPCSVPDTVLSAVDQTRILQALYAIPNGVFRMSPSVPGLVETSNNLAKVEIGEGVFSTQCLMRSALDSGIRDIAQAVRAVLELAHAQVDQRGGYPGWAPNPDSPIVRLLVGVYEGLFSATPKVAACHAGLECGIIGKQYPGLDMVSLGPTIRHPHSPDEKVNIQSVANFWKYLVTTLSKI